MVIQFFADHFFHVRIVFGKRDDGADVLFGNAQAFADGLNAARACAVLAAGHAGGEVVGDAQRDIQITVHGIQEAGHAAVGEGGIPDDGYCGVGARVGRTLGHGERGTHFHAGVEAVEGGHPAQRVAADVAKDAGTGVVFEHVVEGGVEVPVAAALAQCRGARGHYFRGGEGFHCRKAQGRAHRLRRKFSVAGQAAVQAAFNGNGRGIDAPQPFFYQRLAFFHDQDGLAVAGQFLGQFSGEGILGNLEHRIRAAVRKVLHEVVIGNAAGNDAKALVRAICEPVERGGSGIFLKAGVVFDKLPVADAGVHRQGNPLARILGVVEGVLLPDGICAFYHGAGMGHTGGHPKEHRDAALFRVVKGGARHGIGLRLVGGFKDGHHGKGPVEAGILLVL